MSHIRLGFTEATLLVIYLLKKSNILTEDEKIQFDKEEIKFINWLYSTSGFYDKEIKGQYFDYDYENAKKSVVYNEYFERITNTIKNTDCYVELCLHKIFSDKIREIELKNFLSENYNLFNKNKNKNIQLMNLINNKKVLIVNSIASLMKQQFYSVNRHKINPNFPKNVKNIETINTESTIVNDGPDNNILETSTILCSKINEYDFDIAIVSVGAYSILIADFIINNLKKECYIIGGTLPYYFGIITKRTGKELLKNKIFDYLITVPEELKPENYMKVEHGCYW